MLVDYANLQLEGYYVRELHCSVRNDADDDAKLALLPGLHVQHHKPLAIGAYPLLLGVEAAQHATDWARYRVELNVKSKDGEEDEPLPYCFDLKLTGFFRINGESQRSQRSVEPFMLRNAAMILYSSARELLAAASARGPFPAIILPTLSFDWELGPDIPVLRPPRSRRKLTKKTGTAKKYAKKK